MGLSGGVDSAVSVALLQEAGFDVTGVFIRTWQPDWIRCTWKEERLDAMRVAGILNIPFITLDLENEYKKDVADYMISEYRAGRTPNPDVMCNKIIKFGGFLKFALKNGADFVATGHYARGGNCESSMGGARGICKNGASGARRRDPTRRFLSTKIVVPVFTNTPRPALDQIHSLLRGLDSNKDQSYFLWTLSQEQLKHIIFPVGHLNKAEVRKLAKKFNLPQAVKKDSQGICFLGDIDMKDFLSHYIKNEKGRVMDTDGNIIGEHDGALFFTLGERHGFRIFKKGTDDKPLFVIAKDADKNEIIVSSKNSTGHLPAEKKDFNLHAVNWISGFAPKLNTKLKAQVRYRQEAIYCTLLSIDLDKQKAIISFKIPQLADAGQSIVIYDGEKCLGGGVIL